MEHPEDFSGFAEETEDSLNESPGDSSPALGLKIGTGHEVELLGGGDEEDWEEEESTEAPEDEDVDFGDEEEEAV